MKKRKRILKWLSIMVFLMLSGMVLFLAFRPEGRFTTANGDTLPIDPDAMSIKILTWNILRGGDESLLDTKWSKRKPTFTEILSNCDYDIICMQEVLPEQLVFFSTLLADYDYIAAGRQDGKSKGEHGPVFYKNNRFELLQSETFWLSSTPETPSKGWGEPVPRICTWIEFKDIETDSHFRIYNTHLHVHPYAQVRGAKLLAKKIRKVDIPLILTGDLNAPPGWPALDALEKSNLQSAETSGALTYHINGKAIRCLDHILHTPEWTVHSGGFLKDKTNGVYPSDHFGLWTTLSLKPATQKEEFSNAGK